MAKNAINVLKWVNPREPIRSALGDMGFNNMFQTHEPDLIRWCIEAQDLISKPKTEQEKIFTFKAFDNKIALCPEISMVECVHNGCNEYIYKENGSCHGWATEGCCGRARRGNCGEKRFTIDGCYIHFEPEIQDDAEVTVKALVRRFGADGYPLVADVCTMAISEYIKMKMCFLMQDNRYGECQKQWLVRCIQARTAMNLKQEGQIRNMGRMNTPGVPWFGGVGYYGGYGFGNY